MKDETMDNENSAPSETKHPAEALYEREQIARKKASHNGFFLVPVNSYSAVVVFVLHLISAESLISIALSVALTIFVYNETDESSNFDGSSMSWVLLSFAVITPLSGSIGMAFARRDAALKHIANIRSTLLELYAAHARWDWGFKPGQDEHGRERSSVDFMQHADKAYIQIFGLCHELARWLTLPNSSRARHRMTVMGQREATQTLEVASELYGSCIVRMGRLADLCEVLKREGLPPNEATRIRQWERIVLENVESARMIKMYRTPQALRSFSRLFSILLPPFYSPYYAQLARDVDSLGVAVAYSIVTSIALTALFETVSEMEDPFTHAGTSLDVIDMRNELVDDFVPRMSALRKHFFPDAEPLVVANDVTSEDDGSAVPTRSFVITDRTSQQTNPDHLYTSMKFLSQ